MGANISSDYQWWSQTAVLPATGSNQYMVLTGAYVPSGGKLYLSCDVGAYGFIHGVVWAQI
ncbi:hypothetical protein KRR26_34060 [Corallococcus sp. M34]|uniref:hypothetical protein n=1 Tax=Citreicoccus inhibens TaxID=2849499 RepID=UPI001C24E0E3|nr:hypothetical protein [Citreicoccus inhibens]MBU8900647.1 hypothetical protein [Citreicoccus inhibens]